MSVATGLAQGRYAEPVLAARAVEAAMELAGLAHPSAVLLFLTSDFAADPQAAVTAAARAANCLQVSGCTAAGVFTEEDWVLDAPAAVAMVFGDGIALHTTSHSNSHPAHTPDPTLTFVAPNALDMHWLSAGGLRIGGVSGDATGQGPYSVWMGGRVQNNARCELGLSGVQLHMGVSQGIRPLTHPAEVKRVQGHDVYEVGGHSALSGLVQELPLSLRAPERIPTHLLMAGIPYGEPLNAMEEGRFHLLPVVGVNAETKSITVAAELPPGIDLFWAMRQPQAAEHDMRAMLQRTAPADPRPPAFGLMFPCIGRGPWFYGGRDRDIEVVKQRYPDMPLIGFYGNGEIAHTDGANRLLQYSVVLGLGYEANAVATDRSGFSHV
jgi:small ligand-binding sensory domain FIST